MLWVGRGSRHVQQFDKCEPKIAPLRSADRRVWFWIDAQVSIKQDVGADVKPKLEKIEYEALFFLCQRGARIRLIRPNKPLAQIKRMVREAGGLEERRREEDEVKCMRSEVEKSATK